MSAEQTIVDELLAISDVASESDLNARVDAIMDPYVAGLHIDEAVARRSAVMNLYSERSPGHTWRDRIKRRVLRADLYNAEFK